MGHGRGVAAERMLRHGSELGLSDNQIAKLEMLSYETKKRLIDLHADIDREQLEVHKRICSGDDDLTQIKRHLTAISKARVGIQEAKIENLFESRKILTDEQKEMVKEKHPRLGRMLDE
jgi:Spy/CpxP family protein refolding chaperone